MTSRKIGSFGAGRKHAARGSLRFLPGGADSEASPDRSDGEGQGSSIPCPSPSTKVGSAPEGTEGSAPETEFNMVERAHARVDKYAWIQVAREHYLRQIDTFTLLALSILAEYQSASLITTLQQLAMDLRVSPKTMAASIRRLEKKGLIEVADPFMRNDPGRVIINVYWRMNKGTPTVVWEKSEGTQKEESTFGDSPTSTFAGPDKVQGATKEEGRRLDSREGVAPQDSESLRRLRQAFPGAEEVS